MEEDRLRQQFALERLGDGTQFVEATCRNCRSKLTIEIRSESINERLEQHAQNCRATAMAKGSS